MTDRLSLDALPSPYLRPKLSIDNESEPFDAAGRAPDLPARKRELEALYRSHGSRVVGYFQRQGQSEQAALDLTQETFINAWRGLSQFNGRSKLSTWLWAIAKNALLADVRGRKPDQVEANHSAIDPDSLSYGDSRHLNPLCDCVRRGFAAFSVDHPERAEVVYLAVVEGWTREELASHLGRSLHAATEYLSQCKARFRPYIEDCHGE